MDKKHEVEYRALISPEVFKTLFEHGKADCAASFRGPRTIKDAYFCPRAVKDFSEIEMDAVGSYSLRLRQEVSDDKTEVTLNTKVINNVGDHNAWLEHEVTVSSYGEGSLILEAIGFKKFFEFQKHRYTFNDGEVSVCLEQIDNFQPVIELEILTTEDGVDEAKAALLAYFESNGISQEQIVKKSITNLLMRERASF